MALSLYRLTCHAPPSKSAADSLEEGLKPSGAFPTKPHVFAENNARETFEGSRGPLPMPVDIL